MKLELRRFDVDDVSTLGLLKIDGRRSCFILEPARRIPAGTYLIALQTVGRLDAEYAGRFASIHRGMLTLQDVPGFVGIMLHCGNTETDSEGCLLVGEAAAIDGAGRGRVESSAIAYVRMYPAIARALERGDLVGIDILDEHLPT